MRGKRRDRTTYRRKCHDCGRPTNNFRCEECWAKIRNSSEYYMQPQSYHGLESMESAYE